METLKSVLREALQAVNVDEAKKAADTLRPFSTPGYNLTQGSVNSDEEELKWLAGQFLLIVDGESWYVMNTWIDLAAAYLAGPAQKRRS